MDSRVADAPLEEVVCYAICKSGRFETGHGTCALSCMDQLGDARKRPCQHAARIHAGLAKAVCEAVASRPTPEKTLLADLKELTEDRRVSADAVGMRVRNYFLQAEASAKAALP